MTEFLHMGGYAAFVWPSYGIVAVIVALNIFSARRALVEAKAAARRRIAPRPRPE